MSELLFIKLAEHGQDPIQWGIKNDEQSTFLQQGTLSNANHLIELKELSQSRRVIVIAPASKVTYMLANFPSRQARHIAKALPFALEEQLADDISKLHFATAKHLENGLLPVAIVRHKQMQQWQKWFEQAQIEPYAMVPEYLLMAHKAQEWQVYVDEHSLFFYDEQQHILSGDAAIATISLQLHLERRQAQKEKEDLAPVNACTIHCPNPEIAHGIEALLPAEMAITHVPFDDGFYHLAAQYRAECFNLLQGSYSRSDKWLKILQHWKIAASLLVVYLLTELVTAGLTVRDLKQQEAHIKQQQVELYKSLFPETKRFNNLSTQMKGKLNALKQGHSDASFINLMHQVGGSFTNLQQVKPRSIFYDQKREEMRINLNGKSFQHLEGIQQQLSALNLTAALGSASQDKDGSYSGSLTIQAK